MTHGARGADTRIPDRRAQEAPGPGWPLSRPRVPTGRFPGFFRGALRRQMLTAVLGALWRGATNERPAQGVGGRGGGRGGEKRGKAI